MKQPARELMPTLASRLVGCRTVLAPFDVDTVRELNGLVLNLHDRTYSNNLRRTDDGLITLDFEVLDDTEELVDAVVCTSGYYAVEDMLPFLRPGGRVVIVQHNRQGHVELAKKHLQRSGLSLGNEFRLLDLEDSSVLLFFKPDNGLVKKLGEALDVRPSTDWLVAGNIGRRTPAKQLGNTLPHEYLVP
jgi:hypothetical protein